MWEKVSHPIKFWKKSFVPHKKNAKKFRTPADYNTTGYRQLKVTDPLVIGIYVLYNVIS